MRSLINNANFKVLKRLWNFKFPVDCYVNDYNIHEEYLKTKFGLIFSCHWQHLQMETSITITVYIRRNKLYYKTNNDKSCNDLVLKLIRK